MQGYVMGVCRALNDKIIYLTVICMVDSVRSLAKALAGRNLQGLLCIQAEPHAEIRHAGRFTGVCAI